MQQDMLPGFSPRSELPMLTLTPGCALTQGHKPNIYRQTLLSLADLLLCVYMKTAGNGIQQLILHRRGLSLIRDIGLKSTYRYLISLNKPTYLRASKLSRQWSASETPLGS